MRKVLSIVLAMAVVLGNIGFAHVQPVLGVEIETEAASAILMDAASGRILYEKEAQKELPPASVTKIMTLLVAAEAVASEKVKLTDIVTASENACKLGGSQIYLEPGETFTLEQMLIAIAVGSANDGCVAVAEHINGTHEAFVEEMNRKAQELGLKNTHFANAYGLPAEGHYTSAYDLAMISKEALNYPLIRKLTSMKEYDLREGKFKLWNTNKLLWWYPGADGLKTGWTNEAKYCLASTVERNGLRLICVVMGVPQVRGHFAESMKIYNYGFAKYEFKQFAPAEEKQGVVKVSKGVENEIIAITEKSLGATVEKGKDKNFWVETKLNPEISAPIEKGQKLGEVLLYQNDQLQASVNLIADHPVAKAGLIDQLGRTMKGVFGF
ncbi:D-alanyl-D-alanine carboxypeptidase family protein [Desulfosporosinus nitroreducens]|uniref:serine-type D-Ala-D-Ala carboxypeptidase n=1 Tax=Desulfosporosinus nitroreducens TaxID=2018668 RepID=A0ABT8QNP6_9FIRM|nr:D-alanyl-D-alanine carboxypeptidase family protein [Desulfosporosinus nitroreducens]MCO1599998.1 D-alanyl-D-alanine carboxypeptidase [Desulfosporosinus nitroreducens]MDO0822958.1 D-alanyl-D-alanine carboxypeptidase [Desulfosporosinus nitroreducens]